MACGPVACAERRGARRPARPSAYEVRINNVTAGRSCCVAGRNVPIAAAVGSVGTADLASGCDMRLIVDHSRRDGC